MTINHIDQLNEWWDAAEEADEISVGDLVIEDRRDREGGFDIWPARTTAIPLATESRRILSRAPKPKPAWHDAVAVIAIADVENGDAFTCIWAPDGQSGYWESCEGFYVKAEALRYVTPLIEAKVTHEMVARATASVYGVAKETACSELYEDERDDVRATITAALGLDPA